MNASSTTSVSRGSGDGLWRYADGKVAEIWKGSETALLDLATMKSRRLTRLDASATMLTLDIAPDGQRIVFDGLSDYSDIVLIELEAERSTDLQGR